MLPKCVKSSLLMYVLAYIFYDTAGYEYSSGVIAHNES